MKFRRLTFALAFILPILQACSNSSPPATAASAPPAAATAPDAPTPPAAVAVSTDPKQACNLVTAAEMSSIAGSAMVATPADEDGISNCKYEPAGGRGSSVDFTVIWGDGESTLKMDREMKDHDAEADKRFAGVGDDAVVVAPTVQVRQGKDLVVLTLFGFDDEPATARKILEIAKARM